MMPLCRCLCVRNTLLLLSSADMDSALPSTYLRTNVRAYRKLKLSGHTLLTIDLRRLFIGDIFDLGGRGHVTKS